MFNKFLILVHHFITWLYHDSEKAFGAGGFIGAGFTATMIHLNYWYWAKVVVSAVIGGLVNILIKKLVDSFNKKSNGINKQ